MPTVSRLVAALSRAVRYRARPVLGSLKDYVPLTLNDVFEAEIMRKVKSVHLGYEAPGSGSAVVALCSRVSNLLRC